MSILIPSLRIATHTVKPVLFSGNQEAPFGGETLQVPRVGDRSAIELRTAQLRNDAASRQLIAALTQATTADARFAFLQPNLINPATAGGSVQVNGAGQVGSSLALRGIAAGIALEWGRYLHIAHGGKRYVHMLTANATVSGTGTVTIGVWPMLRFLTVDGTSVELDAPEIEGQLVGFDGASFERARTNPISFSIVERA